MQLHNQLPLAGDPKQVAAHQRQEYLLGRDRRPADGRVQVPAGASDRRILNGRPNGAQRMLRRNEGFQRELVASAADPRVPSSAGSSLLQPRALRPEWSQKIATPSTLGAAC